MTAGPTQGATAEFAEWVDEGMRSGRGRDGRAGGEAGRYIRKFPDIVQQ